MFPLSLLLSLPFMIGTRELPINLLSLFNSSSDKKVKSWSADFLQTDLASRGLQSHTGDIGDAGTVSLLDAGTPPTWLNEDSAELASSKPIGVNLAVLPSGTSFMEREVFVTAGVFGTLLPGALLVQCEPNLFCVRRCNQGRARSAKGWTPAKQISSKYNRPPI